MIESVEYHHKFQLYDIESGIQFTDIVEIHVLELKKLPDQPDQTKKYNWLKFFNAETREEFELLATKDEQIKKAYQELQRLSQDEEAMFIYEQREKMLRDEMSRLEFAREEGLAQGKEEAMLIYEQREKMLRDEMSRLEFEHEEGLAQGKEEAMLEIAKSLLSAQMPIEFVTKHTGFDELTVKHLQKEFNSTK